MAGLPDAQSRLGGLGYAMAAVLTWGLFPAYFKSLDHVPTALAIAHRMLWAAPFLLVILLARRRIGISLRSLENTRVLYVLLGSAILMGASWFLYIWAVHNERIVEASLGYYLTPLMSVVIGLLFFKEQLSRWQQLAIAIATAGVCVLIVFHGTIPWVGLLMGLLFAIYTAVRKLSPVDSTTGMLVESFLLVPTGLSILWLLPSGPIDVLTGDLRTDVMLVMSAIFTVLPVLWYVAASKRLELATLGILFFIAPSIGFLCGVFIYNEPVTWAHAVMFGAIWTALVIYSVDMRKQARLASASA